MELAEFRTVSELTVSDSPDILKNYLSSFTETDTETVGSSHLIDIPRPTTGGVQPITLAGRVSIPCH